MVDIPKYHESLHIFVQAFFDLMSDRNYGADGTALPIPWSVKKDYADTYCIDDTQRDLMILYITAIDSEYLAKNGGDTASRSIERPKEIREEA